MQAKYAVTHYAYTGVGEDDYGNEIETWGPGVEVKIYGLNFPKSAEPIERGHNRLIVDVVMLTPKSLVCGEKDRFKVGADMFEVVGVQSKADRNPMPSGWNPGGYVYLRRTQG